MLFLHLLHKNSFRHKWDSQLTHPSLLSKSHRTRSTILLITCKAVHIPEVNILEKNRMWIEYIVLVTFLFPSPENMLSAMEISHYQDPRHFWRCSSGLLFVKHHGMLLSLPRGMLKVCGLFYSILNDILPLSSRLGLLGAKRRSWMVS